jgi:hypothetical protein
MGTPNRCGNGARLLAQFNSRNRVSAAAFDGSHVEPELVSRLMCAFDVESNIARRVVTRHACSFAGFADLALVPESVCWDQCQVLCGLQVFRVAKLDLGNPHCTRHMHPVVPICSLEGFPGTHGFALFLLSLAVEFDCFDHHVFLQLLLLPFPIAFLLM